MGPDLTSCDACILDVDGVVTETASGQGVAHDQSTVRFLEELRARGVRTAAVFASHNAHGLLERADVLELFDVRVTGADRRELDLAGTPAPDVLLEAARRLGTEPARTAMVVDAVAGLEAGRAGGFRLVVGVDRSGGARLGEHGADTVVTDLGELLPLSDRGLPRIADLAQASTVLTSHELRELAVFLDYDGTLTPIVDDPAEATLDAATRRLLAELAEHVPVAIVSGRDLADVRSQVDLEELTYAGSHGFDIQLADGTSRQLAEEHLDDLDRAEEQLRSRLADVERVRVERKRFAVAVHDRSVERAEDRERVAAAVAEVAEQTPSLRLTGGKRIHELRPDIEWDKGRAVVAVRDAMGLHDRTLVYVGDDSTDEDGFRSVKARGGLAIVVRGEDDGRRTLADGVLDSPDEVRVLLEDLLSSRPNRPNRPDRT